MKTEHTLENVRILSYRPQYAIHFDRLNKAWLEEFFVVEPIDKYVLEHPEEAILQAGGEILFAEYNGTIIGTVALKLKEKGVYELTKMAVDKSLRGHGTGKLLCKAAIQEAKRLKAHTLILYSQRQLENAIAIYRKLGFEEQPLEPGVYKRADIKMSLTLTE